MSAIAADRRSGASYADLAARHGVAEGTIANALRRAEAERVRTAPRRDVSVAPDVSAPTGEAPTGEAPPTQDELRQWLASQVRALQADADRARDAGDRPALERLSRQLVTASGLLARVTPPDAPTQDEITAATMAEHAQRARDLLHRWVLVLTSDDPRLAAARDAMTRDPRVSAREELALMTAQIARKGAPPTPGEAQAVDLLREIAGVGR